MTKQGVTKYRRGQRGEPAANLIKNRSSTNTQPDGHLLVPKATFQTVIDTLTNEAYEPIFVVRFW
ncbi:nitrogen fixation protein NifZ [Bradyrhizobium sp. PMVTL-01]|uniref:nitrogen fixation protein NifZ n=1 Tax=Bradyrhizobium sp. PMVTL-01 TaxID=3434999 RepID=UPI003F6FF415